MIQGFKPDVQTYVNWNMIEKGRNRDTLLVLKSKFTHSYSPGK